MSSYQHAYAHIHWESQKLSAPSTIHNRAQVSVCINSITFVSKKPLERKASPVCSNKVIRQIMFTKINSICKLQKRSQVSTHSLR